MSEAPAHAGADAPGRPPEPDRRAHLKEHLRVISARRWTLISTVVLVVLAVTVWVLVQTPIYRVEAVLLIEPAKTNLTEFKAGHDPALVQGGGALARREFFETQYKLIVAQPLLERTFQEFDFADRPTFRGDPDPIAAFGRHFTVSPVRRSRLVTVAFEWPDPELAARVLDFLLSEYIADYRRRSLGVTMAGLDALREKTEQLRPKLERKADELQRFMVTNNMVSLEKTQNIVVDRLKELNRSLSEAERRRIEYDAVCQNVKQALGANRPLEDMPEVIGSSAIRDLKLEYIRARQEVNDLNERFGRNHPEVVAAKARLDTVSQKMGEEVRSALAAAEAQRDRAVRQADELRDELARQEQRVMAFNKLAVRYNVLKSDYNTLNKTHTAISKRIEEIEITMAAGSKDDNIFVITPPRVPAEPAKPRKRLAVTLAGIVGLALGVGLCFFIDYLDTTIKTRDDVDEALGVPTLGYVPALRDGNGNGGRPGTDEHRPLELLAVDRPRSPVAEAFRSLRTALAFSGANGDLKRLLVTSSSPQEGKTLVSLNVAVALARAGKRVLLVDADLRRPRLHKVFDQAPQPGLSNILAGERAVDLDQAARPVPGVEGLWFLPSGPIPPNPADLLGSARMRDFVEAAGAQYDVMVFDTPPAVSLSDAAVLCQYVNGVLMVVRSFSTQRHVARHTAEQLGRARAKLLGVVLNNADIRRGRPGYYYYYYDGYYYDQQYYYTYAEDGERTRVRRRRRRAGSAERT